MFHVHLAKQISILIEFSSSRNDHQFHDLPLGEVWSVRSLNAARALLRVLDSNADTASIGQGGIYQKPSRSDEQQLRAGGQDKTAKQLDYTEEYNTQTWRRLFLDM